ncbi:S-layer homology domain-containing protein [Paenibacillus sp. GCM10027626]|uniref:S-layer homology domain-containing protein n=1 Tax=Paenibacillus sp. GCM10027626 TaxID=3273411 RepID=UPI0036305CCA
MMTEAGPVFTTADAFKAAMLVRAYAYSAGSAAWADDAAALFTDMAAAPEWAKQAVSDANALGLMQGRAAGKFAPTTGTTRAESAQAIYQLWSKLSAEK